MMRLLITGGAGCLGSNLVERYHARGADICIIDNFATGKKEVLSARERLQIFEGSVADAEMVGTVFKKFEPTHVIHSAAAYKDPQNWTEDTQTNVLGSINVCEASSAVGVSRIVNFQTALCFGRPASVPIPPDAPTAPFTSYGISKTAGEAYMLASGLPVVSLRLANICGPRLAIGPIPTFYRRLKEQKNCFCSDTVRDFLDMTDFFALMDTVLEQSSEVGSFNVSTGKGHSIKDVYDAVANYLAIDPPDVPIVPPGEDDVSQVVLDPTSTEHAFGWKAKVGFVETIANQLRWYDQHGINDIFSHLGTPELGNGQK